MYFHIAFLFHATTTSFEGSVISSLNRHVGANQQLCLPLSLTLTSSASNKSKVLTYLLMYVSLLYTQLLE